MVRIGALIPIRLDSTRLPQKALQDVAGVPALLRLITQIRASGVVTPETVIICTTNRREDDPLVDAAAASGVAVFRGSTDDLIDRLYRATRHAELDVVLEVDGDDICAEPSYMAACVERVIDGTVDVAVSGEGLPLGLGSKAFRAKCLQSIFDSYVPGQNDTGFGYYLTKFGLFTVSSVAPRKADHVMPDLRLTLDYAEDLELLRVLYGRLRGTLQQAVTVDEICSLIRHEPHLKRINADLDASYWQRTRHLLQLHPLRLRVAGKLVELTPDEK